ncbi:MAG: leucine-rich repeat domain-containing protein [Clostridia bacterium]|nr:leucine-rich repeat domain-containing protein [Clostridia bacterium]
MKTRKNNIIEFDDENNIYIHKNIIGIDGNCIVPYMPYKITVHKDNTVFCSKGNCLIEVDKKMLLFAGYNFKIPDDGSVKIIGIHAFAGRTDFDSSGNIVEIPPCVKHIYPEAFYMAWAEYVVLHNGLKTIGTRAFAYSAIQSIYIPHTVSRIAKDAFLKCGDLVKIRSDSPHYIANNDCLIEKRTMTLIAVCAHKKIIIPDGVKTIASGVFWGNVEHKEIYIPASVHKIHGHNFYDCYRRIYSPCDYNDYADFGVTLIVNKNTYAEYFAKKHNLEYKLQK